VGRLLGKLLLHLSLNDPRTEPSVTCVVMGMPECSPRGLPGNEPRRVGLRQTGGGTSLPPVWCPLNWPPRCVGAFLMARLAAVHCWLRNSFAATAKRPALCL
jgi:hypothetical protein